jgi:molybdenum cofactor cytidylyltransferase
MSAVAGIVLAAGTSSRYRAAAGDSDGNKLLLPIGGQPVLACAIEALRGGGVDRICVVTGHDAEAIRAVAARVDDAVDLVHNPEFAAGEMVSSIQAGLRHWQGTTDVNAALIALGDMPLLPASIVARLIDAWRRGCGGLLAPRVGQQRGHPVLVARQFWGEALALPHGAPMRQLLARHPREVALLQVADTRVLADVDTPALYADALNLNRGSNAAAIRGPASPGRH